MRWREYICVVVQTGKKCPALRWSYRVHYVAGLQQRVIFIIRNLHSIATTNQIVIMSIYYQNICKKLITSISQIPKLSLWNAFLSNQLSKAQRLFICYHLSIEDLHKDDQNSDSNL